MSGLRTVRGFEDVWRPPVTPRAWANRRFDGDGGDVRGRLARLAARTPEVMVKVTGRTRDAGHLAAHLAYVTRHGKLEAEGPLGALGDRSAVADVGEAWAFEAELDPRRRANTPVSLSMMLSMPAGTDASKLRDAAAAFAAATFGSEHDYLFVLHTDTAHPHVHLAVQMLGRSGARLNPKKADLDAWRQVFARELRDRGVAAEATPRRARGVTRKAERGPVRRLRDRAGRGEGQLPRVLASAYREAAGAAFRGDRDPRPWEVRMAERQARVRALYLAQARLLQVSADAEDRRLGREVEAFVRDMPAPDSQRLALARELRAQGDKARDGGSAREPGKDRGGRRR